jgi:molecular chaperone DnaK (HSP70)
VSPAASARAALPMPRAVVGIDLGTSHTSLAFAECVPQARVTALPIRQWVAGRRRDAHVLLPSVAYAPLPGELGAGEPAATEEAAAKLDTAGESEGAERWVIGHWARVRSAETVGRGIVSAKSWLCHAGVDRLGRILPWGPAALSDDEKLSPVEVSRRILVQAVAAIAEHHPELDRSEILVVLTVPASFDQTARQLTLMAAEQAGLGVRLLEEPQAAFYEYLAEHAPELDALTRARGSVRVLVCDVGGGTTDLSLIDVRHANGELELRRSAVGRHLLLGGDNMDLAVARLAEAKLPGEPLDAGRLGQLRTAARAAKEALLAREGPATFPLRLLGAGAQLFESTLAIDLPRDEVRRLVLDGFFPLTDAAELPDARRSGFTTLGLPFERDPAITRHVAQFLQRHAGGVWPDAVLTNGGVMRSELVRERLLDCLRGWGASDVVLLSAHQPELAVCRGAVRYGLTLSGHGALIEGGTAQGYYVAIEAAGSGQRQALCVLPRGAREGERHALVGRRFELALGRPARFELYAHDTALHAPGTRVELDSEFQALPPLTTVPLIEGMASGATVRVQLEGELSAVGTVELDCTLTDGASADAAPAAEGQRRFRLAFELGTREARAPSEAAPPSRARPPRESQLPGGVDAQRWALSEEALQRVFGKGRKDVSAREVKDLLRTLEGKLGPRKEWNLELCRKLADLLLANLEKRTRSEDHERLFWMLAGFCSRPGFGHARDAERTSALWSAFDAGIRHKDAERSWQQFWIAWRRVAGGLSEAQQLHLRDAIDPGLAPAELKLKKPKGLRLAARDELFDLASQLERLPAARRAELGGWLLDRTWSDRDPRLWMHIGRIGARVPGYASAHYVLAPTLVARWIEPLLRERWSEVSSAAASALAMSRVTGDEARDISPALRAEVARALERAGAPEAWRRAVLEFVPLSHAEREALFADDLPIGLRLVE